MRCSYSMCGYHREGTGGKFGHLQCVSMPQIYNLGDPRPDIPPRVMASSAMGFKLGYSGFFRPHTKTNANKMCPWMIFMPCATFYVFLFSRSDHNTNPTDESLPNTPNLSPKAG